MRPWLRGPSGEAIPAQGCQGVNVAFGLQPGPHSVRGGGILETCCALFRDRSGVGHHARDAEIGQQRFAVGREEHVAGGHITVGEALAVKVCQGLRDRSQDRHRFAGTQTSPASHERRQRAAGCVVQRKPEAAAARVVNRQAHHRVHAKQVAVCQGGEDPDFAPHDVLGLGFFRCGAVGIEAFEGELAAR